MYRAHNAVHNKGCIMQIHVNKFQHPTLCSLLKEGYTIQEVPSQSENRRVDLCFNGELVLGGLKSEVQVCAEGSTLDRALLFLESIAAEWV